MKYFIFIIYFVLTNSYAKELALSPDDISINIDEVRIMFGAFPDGAAITLNYNGKPILQKKTNGSQNARKVNHEVVYELNRKIILAKQLGIKLSLNTELANRTDVEDVISQINDSIGFKFNTDPIGVENNEISLCAKKLEESPESILSEGISNAVSHYLVDNQILISPKDSFRVEYEQVKSAVGLKIGVRIIFLVSDLPVYSFFVRAVGDSAFDKVKNQCSQIFNQALISDTSHIALNIKNAKLIGADRYSNKCSSLVEASN